MQISETPIRDAARQALAKLYEAKGRQREFNKFYPVEPRAIIELIGWNFEEVDSLGSTPLGETITAHCDFPAKTIRITSEALSGAEGHYCLAHEIGHAILHQAAPICIGGTLVRRSSSRKQRQGWSMEEQRQEREADIFARELLMPGKAVRYYFKELVQKDNIWHGSIFAKEVTKSGDTFKTQLRDLAASLADFTRDDLTPLKKFFGVSRSAMANRLIELGLVV